MTHDEWTAEEKKAALTEALRRGVVGLLIDMDMSGVEAPSYLHGRDLVRFDVSWKYDRVQLKLDEDGVTATLRFRQTVYHRCSFPWPSVRSMVRADGSLVSKARPALTLLKGGARVSDLAYNLCDNCLGDGEVCDACSYAKMVCQCEEPQLVTCDECNGTGLGEDA